LLPFSGIYPIAMKLVEWLVPLVFGVVLTVLLQDPLHWTLGRILGAFVPRPARNVQGIWEARYTYSGEKGRLKEELQLIELRQIGKYVRGRNLTGRMHWYKMRGKLELESYLTGVWENVREGDIHHGAFQFVVAPDGESMEGLWLGFDRKHEIQHGPWRWSLRSRSIRKAKAEATDSKKRDAQ